MVEPMWRKRKIKHYLATLAFLSVTSSAMANSHYETLGVPKEASTEQIKTMYRKLAMKYHPDRFSDGTPEMRAEAEIRFKEINTAYSILSDEKKRFAYDQNPSTHFQSKSFSKDADTLVENLKNSIPQGPHAVSQALRDVAQNFEALIDSAQTIPTSRLFSQFYGALDEIQKRPELVTAQILSDFMFMNSAKEKVYAMRQDLDYYEGRFDISRIELVAGRMLESLATRHDVNLPELFATLADYTTTEESTRILNFTFKIQPFFTQEMSGHLYELGVQSGMIGDAKTLRFFIQNVARKIFDNDRREPLDISFLSSKLHYTLQILRTSSYEDALYIMNNLKQMDSVQAYEELIRSEALKKLSAEQVLTLLKQPRFWADRYLDGHFGPTYTRLGQQLAARLKSANLTFARDFSQLSPTSEQIKEFVALSDFKFGEYTWAKMKSKPMGPRDYKVLALVPAVKIISETHRLSFEHKMILECRQVFAN